MDNAQNELETLKTEDASATTEVVSDDPYAQLQKAAEEVAQLRDQLLRSRAEFENFRKRIQKEREESLRYANEAILTELLPVLDHFELGMKAAETTQDAKSIAQGFSMVWNQLQKTLAEFGVKPIEAVGKAFDPHLHEAVSQQETTEHPDHSILAEHRRGYVLHDRLLRPSSVVVAQHPSSKAVEGSEAQS